VDQLQHFLGLERKLGEIRQAENAKVEAAEREKNLALAKKGDVEKALEQSETRWQTKLDEANGKFGSLESEYYGEVLQRTIADGLPAERFHNGFMFATARSLIAQSLEIARDTAGNLVVREKGTFRPAKDVIAERLASADFAPFLKPATTGGAGGGGKTPEPVKPAETEQGTFLDRVLAGEKMRSAAVSAGGHAAGMGVGLSGRYAHRN